MKKSSKGFTLVELLVTIVLLGIVATIVIVNMTSISKNSRDREYEQFRAAVLSAASAYGAQNSDVFANLYVDKAYMYITTGDVIAAGYLDEKLVNPYTKEIIGKNELIKAVLDTATGALKFDYPSENNETEQFLVALDDYVVFGEPYDCMNGIGSYKLALSDENGDLITDVNTLINDYNFTCKYDGAWKEWNETNAWSHDHGGLSVLAGENYIGENGTTTNKGIIKYAENAGTYQIKYSFVSKAGILKEFTRNVTVLDTFTPDLEVKVVPLTNVNPANKYMASVTAAQFNSGTDYKTTENSQLNRTVYKKYKPDIVNGNCSSFTTLAFRPILVGADESNSSYSITRKTDINSGYRGTNVSTETLATNDQDFTKVFVARDGANIYNIKMTTVGHYFKKYILRSEADIEIVQDIYIPACKITGNVADENSYTTSRTISINDTYSPVGIATYDTSDDKKNFETFNRNAAGSTSRYYTAISSTPVASCQPAPLARNTVYIRAINNEGFIGDWTPVNIFITNNLYNVLNSEVGNPCSSKCKAGGSSTALGSLNCYYCAPVKSVKYNGNTFNVLGRTYDGTILSDISLKYTLSGTVVTRWGSWGTQTCDGYYSTSYTYSSTVWQTFKSGIESINKKINSCSSDNMFVRRNFGSDNQGYYWGYSAIPTLSDNSLFQTALTRPYWISRSGSSGFTISVHGPKWSTTRYNYYYYSVDSNGSVIARYAGSQDTLNTMHIMNKNTATICSGGGSTSDPYVIASHC